MAELFQVGVLSIADRECITQFLLDCDAEAKRCRTEINKHKSAILSLEQQEDGARNRERDGKVSVFVITHSQASDGNPGSDILDARGILGRRHGVSQGTNFVSQEVWQRAGLASQVRLFLERSKQTSLSISLTLPSDPSNYDIAVIRAVARESSRWVSLSLDGNLENLFASGIFDSVKGHLPLLEHLYIDGMSPNPIVLPSQVIDTFTICPRLRSFAFFSYHPVFPLQLALPWTQIRKPEMGARESLSLLSGPCSSVEELDIERTNIEYDGPHLVHDTVHTVTLHEFRDHQLAHYLQRLTLPSLSVLHIKGSWKGDITPVVSLPRRSACKLTSLSIHGVSLTEDQAIILCRSMPSLKTLHISPDFCRMTPELVFEVGTVLTPALFRLLTIHHDRTPTPNHILPCLEELTLLFRKVPPVEDALRKMLASRRITDPDYVTSVGAKCLKSVDIVDLRKAVRREEDETEDVDEPLFPSLRSIEDAGMRTT
ncbi:hypothetical protein V5O48_017152 [Marasmius crinis-equi]|uniref:Uncharacterized protein n=1 Tax=Marasmius crinis-equi TaxID=585013 RepID=A0ABR3EPR6_9AGAR